MTKNSLVRAVWGRSVVPACGVKAMAFHKLTSLFVSANTIVLEVNSPTFETIILSDDAVVLPGITAGDLLAEELDIDVPYGTLVLVQSSYATVSVSEAVGFMICQLIVALASRGKSSADCVDQELIRFAEIFTGLADVELADAGDLSIELFRKGLSQGLRAYWSRQQGARSSDDDGVRVQNAGYTIHAQTFAADVKFDNWVQQLSPLVRSTTGSTWASGRTETHVR